MNWPNGVFPNIPLGSFQPFGLGSTGNFQYPVPAHQPIANQLFNPQPVDDPYRPVYSKEESTLAQLITTNGEKSRKRKVATVYQGTEGNPESKENFSVDSLEDFPECGKGRASKCWFPRKGTMKMGSTTLTIRHPDFVDYFEQIQGRLGFMAKQRKYVVTKEEMNRRFNGEEQLNSTSVAAFLRRSKAKKCGEQMRAQMGDIGIKVPPFYHQKIQQNKAIPVCEMEFLNMARDLDRICETFYPSDDIAAEVIEESETAGWETKKAVNNHAQDLVDCLNALGAVFHSIVPPITCVEPMFSSDAVLNYEMEKLSSVTHGFGITSNFVWHEQLTKIATKIATSKENNDGDLLNL